MQTIHARSIEGGDPGDRILSTNLQIFMRRQLCKFRVTLHFLPTNTHLSELFHKTTEIAFDLMRDANQAYVRHTICQINPLHLCLMST